MDTNQAKELIDRLRELYVTNGTNYVTWAADAIAALVDERDRLREELAAAKRDRSELLDQMRYVRTHLYAADVQRSPADDQVIADHIRQAYVRVREVIAAMQENRDE